MVREKRLELSRLWLDTGTSSLPVYLFQHSRLSGARIIILTRMRIVNRKFSKLKKLCFFVPPGPGRQLPPHVERDQRRRETERHSAVAHGQQIAHPQVGVVAQQGGEGAEEGQGQQGGGEEGQQQTHHIRAEEIPIVHMGQQQRHADHAQGEGAEAVS